MADLQSPQKFFRQGLTETDVAVTIEFIIELVYNINIFGLIGRYITDCGENPRAVFCICFSFLIHNQKSRSRKVV